MHNSTEDEIRIRSQRFCISYVTGKNRRKQKYLNYQNALRAKEKAVALRVVPIWIDARGKLWYNHIVKFLVQCITELSISEFQSVICSNANDTFLFSGHKSNKTASPSGLLSFYIYIQITVNPKKRKEQYHEQHMSGQL